MKLLMTLLSDAIPGSGEGLSGVIDVDINYNDYGIPFIPAKRLKGILREAALELEEHGQLDGIRVEDIFGQSGNKHSSDFHLYNGYLEETSSLEDFLKWCFHRENNNSNGLKVIFNKQQILELYTYTRSQTTVGSNGIAKDGSLRTFRVLRKGLTFQFDIDFASNFLPQIEKIIKVANNFGLSRTRGFGEIKLELTKDERDENFAEQVSNNENYSKLSLEIENLSQLLTTNQVGKIQFTETYIPGTAINGAFASLYIKSKKAEDKNYDPNNDELFKKLFLFDEVKYSNGYPCIFIDDKHHPTIPAPASFVREKNKKNYFDMANTESFEDASKVQTNSINSSYVKIKDKTFYKHNVPVEIEYHHARPEDRSQGRASEGNGQFFQFEVISPKQTFSCEIYGKKKYLEMIDNLINQNNSKLYLGKSKTSQYGLCKVIEHKIQDYEKTKILWEASELLVITLVSDMMLVNEYGKLFPDPNLLIDEILSELNVKNDDVYTVNSFINTKHIGGYLGVWNLPRTQQNVLSSGSVIVLRNDTDSDIEINSIVHKSFGLRQNEGFGQIRFDKHGQHEKIVEEEEGTRQKAENKIRIKEEIKDIITDILIEYTKKQLVNLKDEYLNQTGNVSNSFLTRMIGILKTSDSFDNYKNTLNQLRDTAKNNLNKVAGSLYLDIKNDNTVNIKIEKLREHIKQLQPVTAYAQELEEIKDFNSDISDDIDNDKLYNIYKDISIDFLTNLKLKKRKNNDE